MTGDRLDARCGACRHVWTIVHLPMPLVTVAKAARNATCPKCGETKLVFVADGAMEETEPS